MRKIVKPLAYLLSAACLLSCSSRYNEECYNKNSLQAKIMNDLINSGEERLCRSGDGELVLYSAKDFTLENKKITAHVIIYAGSNTGLSNDAKYENGTFWNMRPHISFEVFENNEKNSRITYVCDDLTNNPEKLEDMIISFNSSSDKFIFPNGMNKEDVETITNPKLYDKLVKEYERQFLNEN